MARQEDVSRGNMGPVYRRNSKMNKRLGALQSEGRAERGTSDREAGWKIHLWAAYLF